MNPKSEPVGTDGLACPMVEVIRSTHRFAAPRGRPVLLVSAMRHGLSAHRVQALRERLGIDRRTLERWWVWWLENFVHSAFWKAARARFMPLLCESTLPLSLCEAFEIERKDRLLDLLKYLSPLTCCAFLSKQRF